MLDYYNERAEEYEEAYTLGTGTASIADPTFFQSEAVAISKVVKGFTHGILIDIACGTGYWLSHYASQCSSITCIDQSEKMLAECKKKISALGIEDKCNLLCGDFFGYPFGTRTYDTALIGFFMSHLTEDQEVYVFNTLRTLLKKSGKFLIFDSAWSEDRAKVNVKEEKQKRCLNNGTSFYIYKRYFDKEDIFSWGKKHSVSLSLEHFGAAFFAVSGTFSTG